MEYPQCSRRIAGQAPAHSVFDPPLRPGHGAALQLPPAGQVPGLAGAGTPGPVRSGSESESGSARRAGRADCHCDGTAPP
jgi:hypothetical protein